MLRTRLLTLLASLLAVTIVSLSAAAIASPVDGPKCARHRVLPFVTDRFVERLRGGEATTILVSGDGDTDLDLYVYDENGNLVESDTDYTDDCVVRVYPRWTGPFTILVRNRGSVYNEYEIAVY